MHGFAAIVPIGSDAAAVRRARTMVASLLNWEPDLAYCVLVGVPASSKALAEAEFPTTCRCVVLPGPGAVKDGRRGEMVSMVLAALAWIDAHADVDFAIRIDPGGLVISPFADRIGNFFANNLTTGIVGCVGPSCNPNGRALHDARVSPRLLTAYHRVPMTDACGTDEVMDIAGVGIVSSAKRRVFDAVRPHIAAAIAKGYASSDYCQSSSYAVSKTMWRRLAQTGYMSDLSIWAQLPFLEDVTLAMYARAVDVELADLSGPGEPFGIQCRGLPYEPADLVLRKHSVIYSITDDLRYSETAILQFFGAQSGPLTALDRQLLSASNDHEPSSDADALNSTRREVL